MLDLLKTRKPSTSLPTVEEYNRVYDDWTRLNQERLTLKRRERDIRENMQSVEESLRIKEQARKLTLQQVAISGDADALKEHDQTLSLLQSDLQRQRDLLETFEELIPVKEAEIEQLKNSLGQLWRQVWVEISDTLKSQAPAGLAELESYFQKLFIALRVNRPNLGYYGAFDEVCPREISRTQMDGMQQTLGREFGLRGSFPPTFSIATE